MRRALELLALIDKVKERLQAEEINFEDYDRAIECLKQTISPKICINIYEKYINY